MTSTCDELKFYAHLARNLVHPSYDLHKIPSPPGRWGVGHIPCIMRPDYHVQMLEWANRYGGVFKFSLGCQWVVVVSDPAVAAEVLGRGAGSVPRKCVGYQFFDMATNHLGRRSFFTTSDERMWAGVRKATAPAFNMANVRRAFPFVLRHCEALADTLAARVAAALAAPPATKPAPPATAAAAAKTRPPSLTPKRGTPSGSATTNTTALTSPTPIAPPPAGPEGPPSPPTEDRCVLPAALGAGVGGVGGVGWGLTPAVPVGDLQHDLELALLHVFVEALFEVPAEDFPGHEVAAAMNLVLEEGNERLKVPLRGFMQWVTQPKAYAEVVRAQRVLGETYGALADTLRARGPPPPTATNLWACLARVNDPDTGAPLSRDALIPEIGAFMMAGFDTSSHTVAWCLFALACCPGAQAEVREELAAAGLLHAPGASPRPPTLDDLTRLPTLNCVVDETMRMFPVAATASVRELTKPTKVGGYTVPPGVVVWPMLYALHNATHNWEDPQLFKPDRWRARHTPHTPAPSSPPAAPTTASSAGGGAGGGEGGLGGAAGARPKAFLPFSDGMKNCLGQNLGLMEVRTTLVALLSRFHFQLDTEGEEGEAAQAGGEGATMQARAPMVMSLTLKLKGGLRLRAAPLSEEVLRAGVQAAAKAKAAGKGGQHLGAESQAGVPASPPSTGGGGGCVGAGLQGGAQGAGPSAAGKGEGGAGSSWVGRRAVEGAQGAWGWVKGTAHAVGATVGGAVRWRGRGSGPAAGEGVVH